MHRPDPKDGESEAPTTICAGKSVLVVDDEAAVRRFVKAVLERAGLQVLEAENGIEALRMLDAGKPDLLLTDIVMPKMGGIALAQAVDRKMPEMPVLLMSGFTTDLSPALKTKAFIRKPFAPTVLLQTVMQQLRADC